MKSACSDNSMRLTGYLHIIAMIVAIGGTYKQIESTIKGEPFSIWLSLSLTIMLALRLPNQICVAMRESHGWYSVFGTLLGVASYASLFYFNLKYQKKMEDEKATKNK
tara:strand:- start:1075 stop:1398 length:324 start_codon:yes stop_codon:yes gene_type:complete